MQTVLKSDLGEGGSWQGDSHGDSNLYDVLRALAEGSHSLSAQQGTIAAATLAGLVVDKAATVRLQLSTAVGTTGSATQTDVQVNKNGTLIPGAILTTGNAEPNGTAKSLSAVVEVELAPGDLIEIVVSAAPTAGADLTATVELRGVQVEPKL